MTTDKIKPGQGPQRPKPAPPKPPAKAPARPMGKPLPYLGATRQQAPSQAFMPRGVNLGRIMMPDNTRVARKPPTFAANQQRAKAFPLPQRPKQAAKPGLMGRLWGEVKNVGRGARDAVVDTVKGVYEVVRHPKQTAKALIHLAKNPKEIVTVAKTMWKDATKHGVGYAVGYIGANLAPTLLTGGSSSAGIAGRVLSVAGKTRTVQILTRTPTVARHLGRVGKVGQKLAKVGGKVDDAVRAAKATKPGQVLVRAGERVSTLKKAVAQHKYMEPVAKGYKIAKKPVEQYRKLRTHVENRVANRIGSAIRKADGQLLASPKTGPVLRKLDVQHPNKAGNPHYDAQVKALGKKLDQVQGRGGEAGPGSFRELQAQYDRTFEDLALNDPKKLDALQRKAFEEAGFTPKELAAWNDAVLSWTGEMGSAGVGRFATFDDFHAYFREANRLIDGTGEFARSQGVTGLYAKEGGRLDEFVRTAAQRADKANLPPFGASGANLERLQELVDLVAKVRNTRGARQQAIARELGLPPLDATRLELYRGTPYHASIKTVFDAWEQNADTFSAYLRQADSFTADFDVASDFALGGWRSAGTQARGAAEGSVIYWMDVPRERVITDKYSDMGAHAYREAAQRSQQEYVLKFSNTFNKVPADHAVIQFKGEFYGKADLDRLKAAIDADPEAWARVIDAPAQAGPGVRIPHTAPAAAIGHEEERKP